MSAGDALQPADLEIGEATVIANRRTSLGAMVRFVSAAAIVALPLVAGMRMRTRHRAQSITPATPPSPTPMPTGTHYLTFDDGPGPAHELDALLDQLDVFNLKATFFVNGVKHEANPTGVGRMLDRGHMVGWHTHLHKEGGYQCDTDEAILADLELANKVLNRSDVPYRLYRPPYGQINKHQMDLYDAQGYDVIMWDVDSKDWAHGSASAVVGALEECISSGCPLTVMTCSTEPCAHTQGVRECDRGNDAPCPQLKPDSKAVWLFHEELQWNQQADLVFAKLQALGFSFGDAKGCLRNGRWDYDKCRGNGLGGWDDSCR